MSDPIPAEVLVDARRFIAEVAWTPTEAIAPHEYAVRAHLAERGLAGDYDEFVRVIAEHGYRTRFQGVEYTYLEVGDGWRYWQSRSLFDPGTNINRARVDQRLDEQLSILQEVDR